MNNIKLTTMCMVVNEKGEVLVQERIKNDWPGLNFPGGKVEKSESIYDSCIREIKEETNLDISNLKCMGHIEWNNIDEDIRHLCILYRTSTFKGELKDSNEGKVYFIKINEIKNHKLSYDFDKVLDICLNGMK